MKKGREKSIINGHPWIFSGGVEKVDNSIKDGDIVKVLSNNGDFLCWILWNKASQIVGRIISWDKRFNCEDNWLEERIKSAYELRQRIVFNTQSNSYRLIFSESDFLPGIIVDIYNGWGVLQSTVLGMEKFKRKIAENVIKITNCKGVYERSDIEIRKKENLSKNINQLAGEEIPKLVEINEGGLKFFIDIYNGAKTGWYLDQRENRNIVSKFAQGCKVLNCFSYTGSFGLYCLKNGADLVVNVDSSQNFLELSKKNSKLNGFDDKMIHIQSDVPSFLREEFSKKVQYDLIILDPPKFVHSKSDLEKGTRCYKDINLNALRLLKKGSILATFSCSGLISSDLFQKIIFSASLDANKKLKILYKMSQSPDHPILVNFPESEYLKGFLCIVE